MTRTQLLPVPARNSSLAFRGGAKLVGVGLLLGLAGCGETANDPATPPSSTTAGDTTAPVTSSAPTPPQPNVSPSVSPSVTPPPTGSLPVTPSVTPSTVVPPTPPGSVTPPSPPTPPTTTQPTSTATTDTTPTATSSDSTSDTSSEPATDTGSNPPGGMGCDQLLLCEDFESASGGVPDPGKWSLVANYTYDVAQTDLVEVGTEQKHGGSQALHVAANGLAGIVTEISAQKFYVRAYMQVDAAPVGPVLMGIGTDHNSELRFRIQQNSWGTINIIPSDSVLPQAAREGNCPTCPKVTPGEWFCMEFFVDAATKSAGLWLDGVESVNAQGLSDFPNIGDPVHLRFGTMDLQGGSTGLWLDDIAVGTERIGCD